MHDGMNEDERNDEISNGNYNLPSGRESKRCEKRIGIIVDHGGRISQQYGWRT